MRKLNAGFIVKLLILTFLLNFLPVHASETGNVEPAAMVISRSKILPEVTDYRLSADKGFLERKLGNGIKVIIDERHGSGIAAAEFIIRVGNMEEMDTFAGITSVIQKIIMRTEIPETGLSLQESAEEDGCMIAAVSEADYARISVVGTRDIFKKNFARTAWAIKNPDFSPEVLKEVKVEILQDLDGRQNALKVIHELFLKEFYRYHPYRTPVGGFRNTVDRLALDSVKGFYERFFSGDRITVSVAGDIFGPDMMDIVQNSLSKIPPHPRKKVDIPWEPVAQEKRLQMATTSNIAWLFVGFPAPSVKSPDYPKMLLLNGMLGEGLSGRLFIELREKEGMVYEISSLYPQLDGPAHLVMYFLTNGRNLGKARRKFFDEIRKIKREPITEKELEDAKRKVIGKIMAGRESSRDRAFSLAYYTSMGLDSDYDRILIERIRRVSVKELQDTAKKYLENFTVLIIESVPEQPERKFNLDY
jgi:zinc protease